MTWRPWVIAFLARWKIPLLIAGALLLTPWWLVYFMRVTGSCVVYGGP